MRIFPEWFKEWGAANPIGIGARLKAAIWVSVPMAGVVAATLFLAYGNPFASNDMQTGPRGTGMSVTKYADPDDGVEAAIEAYYTEDPIVPGEGETLAGDVYENVHVLDNLTVANFNRMMTAMTQWVAPEQGCAYCHAGAAVGNYASDELYTKVVARRMILMNRSINETWAGHVNVSGDAGVNCYTCHQGQNVPTGIWFRGTPVNESAEGWAEVQNQATMTSQWTSLPSDALEAFLLEDNQVRVHSLEARVAETPSDPNVQTWQDTERTFSLMNYFSNSINRNCVFCHNSRAFYDGSEVTPQWITGLLGKQMVQAINQEYLLPLQPEFPDNRLGPLHNDVAKVGCMTCHKGQQKPLYGMNMIDDWPSLVTTGAPVYAPEETSDG